MSPSHVIIGHLEWANKNINNNLDFMPDDKMDWKPAPKAKSPLDIVDHMADTLAMMTAGVSGQPKKELAKVTTKAEAKAMVDQTIGAHIAFIKALQPEQMGGTAKLEIGEFPMGVAIGMPVIETINHHGQLTYIQTLLGDDESHLLLD